MTVTVTEQGTHRAQLPAPVGGGEVLGDALDDAQQRDQLGFGPGQVVGGEQEERDHRDAGLVAPAEEVRDLVRPAAVPGVGVLQADGPRPPPVAVDDHPDVAGDVGTLQGPGQPALVQLGEDLAYPPSDPHGGSQ